MWSEYSIDNGSLMYWTSSEFTYNSDVPLITYVSDCSVQPQSGLQIVKRLHISHTYVAQHLQCCDNQYLDLRISLQAWTVVWCDYATVSCNCTAWCAPTYVRTYLSRPQRVLGRLQCHQQRSADDVLRLPAQLWDAQHITPPEAWRLVVVGQQDQLTGK